ncbi:MAG TPA: host attachment protein [Steroidobacteraceae bacterium]|nr:host attachment protein [Steroidobacteraceae bacterium]
MRIRIVVADQAEARFYDALAFARPFKFTGALTNPVAHLRDQDLTSDRPGRVFNSAAVPGRRRGASARHSTGDERTPRRHATHLFALRVAAELERARRAGRFERLVLVAAPAFLGELRAALPTALRPYVTATVAKDIVHHADSDVRRYLTRAMFNAPTGFSPAKRAAGG